MPSILASIVNPIQLSEFGSKYLGQLAVHIPGERGRFEPLFGWESLNRVLNSSPVPHPHLKLSHHGKQSKPKDAIHLIRSSQAGATLILENIDRYDESLGDFLGKLSEEIQEVTRFNLYLSYPGEQGYDLHYDTQDFFIFQIAGFKKWWIYPNTIQSPLFDQKTHGIVPPPESSLYLNCTLSPGDVLYVPRGHWHYALAEKEPSMHLTLAVFIATGIDFLAWAIDELREVELFRRNLPLRKDGSLDQIEIDAHAKLRIRDLSSRLAEILAAEDTYKRFRQFRIACDKNRQPFRFPNHLYEWSGAGDVFSRPHQAVCLDCDSTPGKVKVICGGRILSFNSIAQQTLKFVFSSEQFSAKELAQALPALSWDQIVGVLSPLIREGFLIAKRQEAPK